MKVDTTSSTAITATPDNVWEIIADFARNPEWQKGMKSCVWITEPPLRVGSRYAQEASFLGRAIRTVFEVVALTPGSTITIDTVEGTFPITVTRSVETSPTGNMGLLSPLTTPLVRRSVNADYQRLRKIAEN